MDEIRLGVEAWSTWIADSPAVSTTHINHQTSQSEHLKPALQSIPAMQRRRLGPLARVVFHVLEECMGSIRQETVIFSSKMGEIQRTQSILESLAANRSVSPAAFSLSVHNGIAGQWSLIHKVREPQLAIAPPNGSPIPALIEAFSQLSDDRVDEVTIVCYDEELPEFYHSYVTAPPAPTAIALRLTEVRAGQSTLKVRPVGTAHPNADFNLVDLAGLLAGGNNPLRVDEPQCSWEIEYSM